ncbi:SGNH/GDSL hydrolase family protein [Paenarthrobacter aurescens]|uniref:SGNH/GDSL hydrolase family protein n=1 Tax=Paenarthrobacter aurescens TaxID=43663 RepID=UPI0021BF0624|nr:SGNH/GDSL hydrolase family protein [Paenarthrobacter aurescens]MCT9870034.1 SGNH/GDSL hydrolase family protein [Paenarthrobacter aurescens]
MKEPIRFVALGDSFTEGVGDNDLRLPNNCRGWADRVAEEMARHDDSTRYANLAIRGRRLQRIVDEQIEPALAMDPTLVSFYAGGNDLLMARLDMAKLMRDYEDAVRRLKASGATILLFTGYNVPLSPLLEPLKVRTAIYNRTIRRIAAKYQTLLVDYWCFEKFQDPRMWAPDRLHMSTPGHSYMAKKVLEVLGATHSLSSPTLATPRPRTFTENIADDAAWLRRDVAPWLSRRLRGVSSGDRLGARWPEPMPVVLPERLGTAKAQMPQVSSRFS